MDKYFFEIPVYRCTPEQYKEELRLILEDIVQNFQFISKDLPEYDYTQNVQRSFEKRYYGYDYNEVVGWIRLYIFGTQIRGIHYFETNLENRNVYKKRLTKGIRKKRFGESEKAFELTIEKGWCGDEIFSKLLQELESLNKTETPFPKRYFDLEQLKNAGPFIDWRKLVDELRN
jgi:hypothetical protein